jgi:hypothetical protein
MSLYAIALFVHVVGALLVFVLLTVEGVGLRSGMAAARVSRILGPISALAILIPGFYMAAQSGWHAWTAVGLASYAVIAGLGAYTGISVARGRMSSRAATTSWLIRMGIALAVVFDMTVKPDLVGSTVAVVVGVAVAMAAVVPTVRLVRAG